MARPSTPTAIAQWASDQVAPKLRSPNKDSQTVSPRLQQRADRIVRVLRARKAGHTLEAIADQEGISHQAVSKLLAKYGPSTAIEARQIYEARAAAMALHVIEHGRPADQVLVHKALNVLPQDQGQQSGLSITINGFVLSGMGLKVGEGQGAIVEGETLSPSLTRDIHSVSDDSTEAKGNIKLLISPPDSSPSAATFGRGIDGGPTGAGGG